MNAKHKGFFRTFLRRNDTVAALAIVALVSAAQPHAVFAQRGGGMGGGMGGMGGRGGGRGGGMSRGGESEKSASGAVKDNLKKNDLIAFVLDHKKPLKITGQQADTLKAYRKEMLFMQEPVFKDMDKVYSETRGEGRGWNGNGEAGAGNMPADTVRSLIARLNDIQDAYRDRAKAKLNPTQLQLADSLQTAYMAEERDKEAKSSRGRGRG